MHEDLHSSDACDFRPALDDALCTILATGDESGPLERGPRINATKLATSARSSPRVADLIELYELDDQSVAALMIALAPEVDRRYGDILEKINGEGRRAPSPSLLIDLLSANESDQASLRQRFSPTAHLFAERLLRLNSDAMHILDRSIVVDDQIRLMLLEDPGLDPRLSGFARQIPATQLVKPFLAADIRRSLDQAVAAFMARRTQGIRLLLPETDGIGESATMYLAALFGRPFLKADLLRLPTGVADREEVLGLFLRQSVLQGAIVWVRNAEAALSAQPELRDTVARLLSSTGPVLVASGSAELFAKLTEVRGFVALHPGDLDLEQRSEIWRSELKAQGISLHERQVKTLASRYRLRASEIQTAIAQGAAVICMADVDPTSSEAESGFANAARSQGGHALAELTTRITPRFSWDDIVLTECVEQQLREMCSRAELSVQVLEQWGFERKLSLGRGITALFAGPPGGGKTMAAEVVANALGIDLFKVNLAGVVSKYIGETEQNLDRIFQAAFKVNGILLFDEADALFGKRSEVKDARDRYANLEISYLLQKMEEFEGIAILSTNLHGNLDDAFMRRLSYITYFPFPEVNERLRLWQVVWPDQLPMEQIDFAAIAAAFKLSGGNIKQAALSAAYFAASEQSPVSARHIIRGIEREFQKMGRPLQKSEVIPFSDGWRAAS